MTRAPDPTPLPEDPQARDAFLWDVAAGLQPASAPLPAELAAVVEARARVLAAEREAFEPAAEAAAWAAEAPRLAAWVQSTVRHDEAAAARRRPAARRERVRPWSRILALSVGLHVVALAVLAFVLHRSEQPETGGPVARVEVGEDAFEPAEDGEARYARTLAAVQWRELVQDDLGAQLDDAALMEQERLPEEIGRFEFDEPAGWGPPAYPPEVTVPMLRRQNAGLKRRRLDLLGFNARGTLRAVDRGLGILALRQDAETGLFRGNDGLAVRGSALATLAFLGEGHTSAGPEARDAVVARAVAGLRRQTGPAALAALAPEALGPLGVALAEDYMLSYGSLTPHAAAARATELERVAETARARLAAEPAPDAMGRTWLLWTLDAATRAGVARAEAGDRALFEGWVASTVDPSSAAAMGDLQQALAVGMAWLYAERGAEKPGFKRWSQANAPALLGRLRPTGEAREGDPVEATATVLLALQVSYRAY